MGGGYRSVVAGAPSRALRRGHTAEGRSAGYQVIESAFVALKVPPGGLEQKLGFGSR